MMISLWTSNNALRTSSNVGLCDCLQSPGGWASIGGSCAVQSFRIHAATICRTCTSALRQKELPIVFLGWKLHYLLAKTFFVLITNTLPLHLAHFIAGTVFCPSKAGSAAMKQNTWQKLFQRSCWLAAMTSAVPARRRR